VKADAEPRQRSPPTDAQSLAVLAGVRRLLLRFVPPGVERRALFAALDAVLVALRRRETARTHGDGAA
jgi:hypothetical protein